MIRVNNQLVLLNAESRINVTATFGADARLVQCLPDGSTLLVPLRPDGLTDVALADQSRFILTTVGQSSTYDPIALQSIKLQLDALSLRVATIERATPSAAAAAAVDSPMIRPSSPIANKPSVSTSIVTPPRKMATVCEHCRERPVSAVVTQDGASVSLCKPCGLALQQRLEGRVTLKVIQKAATLGTGGELPKETVVPVVAAAAASAAAPPAPVPRPTAVDRPSSPGLTSPRRVVASDIRKPTHAPARPPAARIDGGASRSRPPGVDNEHMLARLPPKALPTPGVAVARVENPTPPLPEVDIDVENLPVVDLSQFGTSARVIDEATTTAAAVELPNQPSTLNHDAARNRTRRAGSIVIVNGLPQHDPVHGHPPKPRRPVRGMDVEPDEDINGADFPLISADEYDEPLPEPPSEADNEPPAATQQLQSSVSGVAGDSEREPPPPPPNDDEQQPEQQQDNTEENLVRESTAQEAMMPRESMPREPMHTFRDKTELNSILTIGLGRDPRAGMVKGVMKVAMSPRPTSPPPALMRTTSPTRPLSPVAGDAPPPQPPQPHVSIRPDAPATRPSVGTGRSTRSIATTPEQLAPVVGAAVMEGELTIRETARTWRTQFIRVVPPYLYVFEHERAAVPRARLALSGATVDEFQTATISHTLLVRNTTTSWLLGCGDESAQRRWQSQLRAVAQQQQQTQS